MSRDPNLDVKFLHGTSGQGWEYFCKSCKQLRFSLVHVAEGEMRVCTNCYSADLIVGEPGTLDKDALLKQYPNAQ